MAQKKISSVLYESTTKLLMESGVTEIFSINRLINYALAETIPDILKELKKEDSIYHKYADAVKRRNFRSIITKIRQEQKSKYFFFSTFIFDLKQLLNKPYAKENIKKKRILEIINLYIMESETFENNESITESLKKYRNGFSKSRASTKTIAELLNVQLINMDRKEIDTQELKKIEENLSELNKK